MDPESRVPFRVVSDLEVVPRGAEDGNTIIEHHALQQNFGGGTGPYYFNKGPRE